ncbi:hypothetical protein HPB47_019382, partial [Ixodes persulcatus]
VYGSPFRLPGKFFDIIKCTPTIPHQVYLDDLRQFMQELKPTQPRMPHSQKIFVSPELKTSTHAFVRNEVKKKSLTPPYEGPFKILERTEKTMTLDINGHREIAAMDRIKPAFQDSNSHPSYSEQLVTPQETKKPRTVSWAT